MAVWPAIATSMGCEIRDDGYRRATVGRIREVGGNENMLTYAKMSGNGGSAEPELVAVGMLRSWRTGGKWELRSSFCDDVLKRAVEEGHQRTGGPKPKGGELADGRERRVGEARRAEGGMRLAMSLRAVRARRGESYLEEDRHQQGPVHGASCRWWGHAPERLPAPARPLTRPWKRTPLREAARMRRTGRGGGAGTRAQQGSFASAAEPARSSTGESCGRGPQTVWPRALPGHQASTA